MAYRLRIRSQEGERRLPLSPGENLVGSRAGCDVVIDHPTVSRDHAVIVWAGKRISIADLGSSNRTFVDGQRVEGSVDLHPGSRLAFGTVEAELEELADDDAIVAEIGARSGASSRTGRAVPPTSGPELAPTATASVEWVTRFTLVHLPALLRSLGEGRDRAEIALLVGEALQRGLPCRGLEIVAPGAAGDAVLFHWGAVAVGEGDDAAVREAPDGAIVRAGEGTDLELRVVFSTNSEASLMRPLIEIAREVVGLAPTAPAARGRPGTRQAAPASVAPAFPEPPTLDPTTREIYQRASVLAASDLHVLIRGESGTGKEVLARFLHDSSGRPDRPLVTLNCAALPRDLLEAELFGIEREVATGVAARAGKFELADGGTVFLDEIGDMALETQAKILRVLQEGTVVRLGSHRPRPARVRVVSATNRDLEAMRRDGAFRDDLYHRIADWVVELPPLRERRVDVPALAAFFLGRESRHLGRRVAGLSRGAVTALVAYDWPGNIRELEREIKRAVLFVAEGELLDTSRLSPRIRQAATEGGTSLGAQLARYEKRLIESALAGAEGDPARAAEALEISVSTLYRKLKKLGIVAEPE